MSNWDLMMPGMGLTSIGLAGVVLAYAEIAHTFIDGLHALAGLTLFLGLIILAVGILDGGISTSNRAKATVLVVLSISLGFGAYAFTFNTISTSATFAGVLMAIAAPATIIAYISVKHTNVVKPVATIFILGSVAGIVAFVGFGMVGPAPYLVSEAEEPAEPTAIVPVLPEYIISMLPGSDSPDAPDYDPDMAVVPKGHVVVWINNDSLPHTATSEVDSGETFDTGLLDAGAQYRLDTSELDAGEYPYYCFVHPWMTSVLVIQDDSVVVSIPEGSAQSSPGQIYYDPAEISIGTGTTVVWSNDDSLVHTVTSGSPREGLTDIFDSGVMAVDSTYSHTFDEVGTYPYFCTLHPWMVGTVTVG